MMPHEWLAAITPRRLAQAGWIALAGWMILSGSPRSRWAAFGRAARSMLGRPVAFRWIAAVSGILMGGAVVAQHLALHTGSHDFGLMDEALAGQSGGRFMHTEVFGYSLLGEHFYLLMATLIPVRRVIDSPWVTVAAHALLLWAALFPLRALLRRERVAPWLVNFACLMYACHPIAARTLTFVFHPEAAYPVCVLSLYWCLRERRWTGYAMALLATLAIKEDAAVYLLGFSAWMALAHGRMGIALATAGASLAWLGLALKVWMPAFGAPDHEYRFIARWVEYGTTPATIASGMLAHPGMLLGDLLGRQPLLMFAGLGGLMFTTRWGWLSFLLPWVINATSVEPMQAGFALYYGAPVLAFALPAAIDGFSSGRFRELAASRFAPALVIMVAVLNVVHVELPRPWAGRTAVVGALATIPRNAEVRTMPCLYPIGGYWPGKRPLMPGSNPEGNAEFVAWLDDHHPWPFTQADLDRLGRRLVGTGWTEISPVKGLHLFRRPGGTGLNPRPPNAIRPRIPKVARDGMHDGIR